MGFLLTPLAAHAQYPGGGSGGYPGGGSGGGGGAYSGPAYSSPGNCTITTPGDPQSPHVYPYALTSSGFGGGNAYSGSSNGTTSVCTGKITATFTWQPAYAGQPPPQNVIVYESASASYGGTILPKPAGTCADGLGDALVPNTSGATSSGTHYTVIAGAPTITRTVTPSANVNCNGGYSGASVSYSAAVYPVTLSLSGTTKDSSHQDNILIGQGCTGTLSAGPATLSGYHWDPGGDTFDKFVVAPDLSNGHVVLLYGDTWAQPNPLWHYSKDTDGSTTTVRCSATASINGTAIGTVQGQRDVQVWAPYYMFKNMAGPVSVDNIDGPLSLYAGGPHTGNPGSGTWDPPGMKDGGRVGTPDLFKAAGPGIWQFVQLASPGRWYYQTSSGETTVDSFMYNGMQGLDNWYPYPSDPGDYTAPYPADSTNLSPGVTAVPTYWIEDSPGEPLQDKYSRVRIDESFDDYMMYEPPTAGLGSEWVPLHLFQWKWQADITETGLGWASGWLPGIPGYVSDLSSTRCTTHPFWLHLLTNP